MKIEVIEDPKYLQKGEHEIFIERKSKRHHDHSGSHSSSNKKDFKHRDDRNNKHQNHDGKKFSKDNKRFDNKKES